MINKFHKIFLVGSTILATSCTNNFEEINTNTNAVEVMSAAPMINSGIKNTISFLGGAMNREIFCNYSGQIYAGGGGFQKFGYVQSTNSTYYKNLYINCLKPITGVIENYSDDSYAANNVAVAKILRAYLYSQAVAIWGAIPMSEALNGSLDIPYDTEEQIYTQIMIDLKDAVESFDSRLGAVDASGDAIYNGDIDKWKKLGNSLRLKIALRLSECADGDLLQELQTTATELMSDDNACINSNDENGMARFDAISGSWSDFYNRCVYNMVNIIEVDKMGPWETLITHMKPYNDPRIDYYLDKPINSDTHFGRGTNAPDFMSTSDLVNPHTGLIGADYSTPGAEFVRADAEYRFMNYAEVCFTKAELALRGWGGKDDIYAKTWYEAGITASMGQAGVDSSEYLTQSGVEWGVPTTILDDMSDYSDWLGIAYATVKGDTDYDIKLNQIVMQHWLATYPYELDNWTLHRRTQILELLPHFNPAENAIMTNANWAMIPQRVLYPSDEYITNEAAVNEAASWLNGNDDMGTKLWFAKDMKIDFTGYPDGLPTESL